MFARLRRETSDTVAVDVSNWKTILDQKVEQCIADNPDHARELMGMMAGLSYGHILYPDAAAMVDSLHSGFRRRRGGLSIDQRAALRIA